MIGYIKGLLKLELTGGVILLLVSMLAMLFANSAMMPYYEAFLGPFHFWINDGLMAIFFLAVGIEIKREILEGELSSWSQAMLPAVAALGGVITPAVIYSYFNWGTDYARGWAIPSATDIAFSLGVLALFARRIPPSLRIFLLAVAVIDDLAAVIIIALFYTDQLSLTALAGVAACVAVLWGLNHRKVYRLLPYLLVGMLLWIAMLKSGVHPTIAGVLLGLLMPLESGRPLQYRLHPWVTFFIVPVFAFANAGVPLAGLSLTQLGHPLPLGIALGLFAGKQLGIFAAAWLLIRLRLASLPRDASWQEFYAVCVIAGIGFTMSLFIGNLAFEDHTSLLYMRVGVIVGSLLSAMLGVVMMFIILRIKKGQAAT
jgi:Na+:H+ antiporter, NhaA family